jgi:2'-5' RNA ligase
MQPGDRLVCALVAPMREGQEFKDWPLHVTIVPWFRTDASPSQLVKEFEQAVDGVKAFMVVMDGEARFGRNKLVNLVAPPTPLIDIESRIRSVLVSHQAWVVDQTTKSKRPYRPHVTAQKEQRLHQGESFICEELYIISQMGGYKEVVGKLGLGSGTVAG